MSCMDPCQSPPSHNSSISDINHPKDCAFVSSTHNHDVPVNLDLPLSLSVGLGLDDNNENNHNNNGGEYSDTSSICSEIVLKRRKRKRDEGTVAGSGAFASLQKYLEDCQTSEDDDDDDAHAHANSNARANDNGSMNGMHAKKIPQVEDGNGNDNDNVLRRNDGNNNSFGHDGQPMSRRNRNSNSNSNSTSNRCQYQSPQNQNHKNNPEWESSSELISPKGYNADIMNTRIDINSQHRNFLKSPNPNPNPNQNDRTKHYSYNHRHASISNSHTRKQSFQSQFENTKKQELARSRSRSTTKAKDQAHGHGHGHGTPTSARNRNDATRTSTYTVDDHFESRLLANTSARKRSSSTHSFNIARINNFKSQSQPQSQSQSRSQPQTNSFGRGIMMDDQWQRRSRNISQAKSTPGSKRSATSSTRTSTSRSTSPKRSNSMSVSSKASRSQTISTSISTSTSSSQSSMTQAQRLAAATKSSTILQWKTRTSAHGTRSRSRQRSQGLDECVEMESELAATLASTSWPKFDKRNGKRSAGIEQGDGRIREGNGDDDGSNSNVEASFGPSFLSNRKRRRRTMDGNVLVDDDHGIDHDEMLSYTELQRDAIFATPRPSRSRAGSIGGKNDNSCDLSKSPNSNGSGKLRSNSNYHSPRLCRRKKAKGPLSRMLQNIRGSIEADWVRFGTCPYRPLSERRRDFHDPRNRANSFMDVTIVGNPLPVDVTSAMAYTHANIHGTDIAGAKNCENASGIMYATASMPDKIVIRGFIHSFKWNDFQIKSVRVSGSARRSRYIVPASLENGTNTNTDTNAATNSNNCDQKDPQAVHANTLERIPTFAWLCFTRETHAELRIGNGSQLRLYNTQTININVGDSTSSSKEASLVDNIVEPFVVCTRLCEVYPKELPPLILDAPVSA